MKAFVFAALLALCAEPAIAAVDITADHGAVWQTSKVGEDTEGFLQIHNAGTTPDTLTGWDCTIATATALVGGDGKPVSSLTIPAGQTVSLAPGGLHFSLQNTHETVDFGSLVPCALTFAEAGQVGIYLNAVARP
jgi:copper(I)-binding protein